MEQPSDIGHLPGEDLVEQGMADLRGEQLTDCALLILIAAPRLRRLGLNIPERKTPQSPEHELYERLEARFGSDAHSQYNSLIRRIVSYARALEAEVSRRSGQAAVKESTRP